MYAVRNKTQADCDTQMMQGPKVSKKKSLHLYKPELIHDFMLFTPNSGPWVSISGAESSITSFSDNFR